MNFIITGYPKGSNQQDSEICEIAAYRCPPSLPISVKPDDFNVTNYVVYMFALKMVTGGAIHTLACQRSESEAEVTMSGSHKPLRCCRNPVARIVCLWWGGCVQKRRRMAPLVRQCSFRIEQKNHNGFL